MLIRDGGHDFARGIGRHHEAPNERRPCSRANTAGTKTRVATVAHNRPPMTARPNGAFCSPPSPSPSAIGTMPMIMARAVISTAESGKAGLDGGRRGIPVLAEPLFGEGH